jgi:hypothetical protein
MRKECGLGIVYIRCAGDSDDYLYEPYNDSMVCLFRVYKANPNATTTSRPANEKAGTGHGNQLVSSSAFLLTAMCVAFARLL